MYGDGDGEGRRRRRRKRRWAGEANRACAQGTVACCRRRWQPRRRGGRQDRPPMAACGAARSSTTHHRKGGGPARARSRTLSWHWPIVCSGLIIWHNLLCYLLLTMRALQ